MKKIYPSLLFVLLYLMMHQRIVGQVKALRVHDVIPEITLNHLIHYSKPSAKLSDFKGKLVILDFWATNCAGCIASWPHLISLQREFADKLQIILVNPWQDQSVVEKTLYRQKFAMHIDMDLPMQIGDTTLLQYFPVSGIPHLEWIDQYGTIISITGPGSASREHIQAILDGKSISMVQSIPVDSVINPVNYDKPIFDPGNGGQLKKLYWQSSFARGSDIMGSGYNSYARPDVGYFMYANLSIKQLYEFAYSDQISVPGPANQEQKLDLLLDNRVDFRVKDSSKYVNMINGEFFYNLRYIYQLISPPTTVARMQKKMQADLNNFVGLSAKWEKRQIPCLVISAEDTLLISYKGGKAIGKINESEISVNNVSVDYCIWQLKSCTHGFFYGHYPLLNETGLKGNLGQLNLIGDMNDYRVINKGLSKYKMHMNIQKRWVKVLVVREPAGYIFPFSNSDEVLSNR